MPSDSQFERLRRLSTGNPGGLDESTLPPEAFESWQKTGVRFGKYVVLGELGRGGTSVVYRAWQYDLRREVALKVVSGLNPELRERFMREARVGAGLKHPAVLPVFETGEAEGSLWLAMPFVKGKTLDALDVDAAGAARCIAAAARGVQAAHDAGVVHRDLKPRNIMQDDSGAVLVMDFGLALTREDSTRISVTGQVLGTPQYMAPEQASGLTADARTDVYGLGATLYRMLSGHAPYECETLQDFLTTIAARDPVPLSRMAAVPRDLETIVLKAMDRDPARRYPTAAALADDLERFIAGDTVQGKRLPLAVHTWRSLQRHPILVVAILSASVAAAAPFMLADRNKNIPQQEAPIVVHPALARGIDFQRTGQYPKAIAEFASVPPDDPAWPDAQRYTAACNLSLRDWPAAIAAHTRYLSVRPEDSGAWRDRANCRWISGDRDGAMKDINQGLTLEPRSTPLLMVRAGFLHAQNKRDLALADYTAAVDAEPDNPFARDSRAMLLAELGRFPEAILDFDAAIAKGGRTPSVLKERGRSKYRTRDFAGALADLKEALALNPKFKAELEKEIAAAEEALKK